MIKVINVISDTNIGGAGTVLLTTLENIDRSKFDIKVVLPEKSALIPKIDALGFEHITTKAGGDKSLDIAAIKEFRRIFKAEKPDIVHTHASLSARIAALLCRVRSRIYTRHSTFEPPKYQKCFPMKALLGIVNNTLATKMIAVSKSTMQNLVDTGANPKKIQVIINGAQPLREVGEDELKALRQRLDISDGVFVAGMSARLELVKGHAYFIEAAHILRKRGFKNFKFIIVGSGSEEANLRRRVSELELSDFVTFCGFTNDVAPYVKAMDVIVNCSFGTEATSMALAEAMSLAKPIIASDFGGNPYMVENGKCGIITPQKNPSALADAVQSLMSDDELRAEMSKAAYSRYLCNFTGKSMTGKIEEVYQSEYEKRCRK